MKIKANGIDIEVQDSGAGDGAPRPAVLLIMGLGMQLVAWPPSLVQSLVDAGYRVVRFDNRDIGLSQHFDHLGEPNLVWAGLRYHMGWRVRSPYSLHDMTQDAIGVLDALGIGQAHVVGVSMGGMIAQRIALAAAPRVVSLTSIMSSSGARGLQRAGAAVMRVLFSRPASGARDDIVAHYLRLFKAIGSPAYPTAEADMVERIALGVDRSFHPAGTLRQMLAVLADDTRAAELARIDRPTLVLHGEADPLVPVVHGRDTARRIRGARFVGIEGMGHDLPPGVVQRLLAQMVPFLQAQP